MFDKMRAAETGLTGAYAMGGLQQGPQAMPSAPPSTVISRLRRVLEREAVNYTALVGAAEGLGARLGVNPPPQPGSQQPMPDMPATLDAIVEAFEKIAEARDQATGRIYQHIEAI